MTQVGHRSSDAEADVASKSIAAAHQSRDVHKGDLESDGRSSIAVVGSTGQ